MMKKNRILISLFSIASLLLMSCAQNGTASTVSHDVRLDDEPVAFADSSASSSARDNTPACLVPAASGKTHLRQFPCPDRCFQYIGRLYYGKL